MILKSPKPMTSFTGAIKKFFKNLFNFRGCSTRSDYWWVQLFLLLIYLGIIVGAGIVMPIFIVAFRNPSALIFEGILGVIFLIVVIIYSILVFIGQLALQVRRLHDINFSGWWIVSPYVIELITYLVKPEPEDVLSGFTSLYIIALLMEIACGVVLLVAMICPSRESKYRTSRKPGNQK